jgi:stearoyl-CoA desaturase (delta-9 desaturase)
MRAITANRYVVLVFVVVPFLATLFAIYLLWERAVHWSDLILLGAAYTLIVLGVGVGFHRMLTHLSALRVSRIALVAI